uniref:NADH-ubiquinone oxidoreductase chain 6 n=1 Tax=Curculionoidea sp. 18 KM-2017 TaxID=2219401 RepID=A0A346RGP0_9CUCU|nr:NADH dehydrogenase subunit 6 [Curculionoidea sp. 18 KM-2017]
MMLNMFLALIFITLNHPISLGTTITLQTILISMLSGMMYYNFWYSYILFLIMVSSMLVMFLYMTSIASNEKFKMPSMLTKIMILLFFIYMIIFILCKDNFYSNFLNISMINLSQSLLYFNNFSLNKFFNWPYSFMMKFLMIYLLITLIAIVKIVGKNWGTLRQK